MGNPVSFTNKTDRHETTEILLKVALNTITLTLTLLNDITSSDLEVVLDTSIRKWLQAT
jgi:hypothetical protein